MCALCDAGVKKLQVSQSLPNVKGGMGVMIICKIKHDMVNSLNNDLPEARLLCVWFSASLDEIQFLTRLFII